MSNICFGLLNYNPMIKLLVWCCDSLWMGRMYGRQSGCHCLSMNSYWFRFCWCLIDLGSQHQQTLMVPKKPAAKYLLCVEQLEFNHHAAVSMLCFIVDGCMYGGQSGHQGLGMSRSTTCLAYVCNRWSSACGCFSVEQRHEVINELSWLLLVFHIMPLAGFHARLWVAASMAAIRSAMLSMLWSLGHQAAFVFFWSPCLGLKVEADFLHSVGVGVYLCLMWMGACMPSSQVTNACIWAFAYSTWLVVFSLLAGFHARLWVLHLWQQLGHQCWAFLDPWSIKLLLSFFISLLWPEGWLDFNSVGVGVYLCFMWMGACILTSCTLWVLVCTCALCDLVHVWRAVRLTMLASEPLPCLFKMAGGLRPVRGALHLSRSMKPCMKWDGMGGWMDVSRQSGDHCLWFHLS